MTEHPLPPLERVHRPHPMIGMCIVRWEDFEPGPKWGGEIIDIVRTSARYGDALAIEIFPRRDGKPSPALLLSVSEIAKDKSPFVLFDGPIEARDWMRVWIPQLAEAYALDFDIAQDGLAD